MARGTDSSFSRSRLPVLGAGWALPGVAPGTVPRRVGWAVDEQSVRESIWIILQTAKGERLMRPEFGCDLHEFVFAVNNVGTQAAAADEVREALQACEPRIDVLEVTAAPAGEHGEVLLISIDYRLRSTDTRFNLVYPFYLDRPLA